MKHSWSLLALVLAVGCHGATAPSDESMSDASQKKAAANRIASGEASADPCAENNWYGDSVCDTFCFDSDVDCQTSGAPVYCAEFIEVEDGTCGRAANDPCRFQDPDCNSGMPSDPNDGVACALYVELGDGECKRSEADPCRFQDPDCSTKNEGRDCDTRKVTCQTLVPVTCPEGQVPTVEDGCYGECVDKSECAPVACLAYVEESDGVCSRDPNDPCISQDPDCSRQDGGTVCAAYSEESDGKCGRSATDPCRFQDPDCTDGGTVCALYVEESDGVCKRAGTDPCRQQDPDCVTR